MEGKSGPYVNVSYISTPSNFRMFTNSHFQKICTFFFSPRDVIEVRSGKNEKEGKPTVENVREIPITFHPNQRQTQGILLNMKRS